MKEYISIKEFAERAKVSPQAIYKRLGKDLLPFIKEEQGRKTISIEALELFNCSQPVVEPVESAESKFDKLLEEKDSIILEQKKEIENLHKHLEASLDIINQQTKQVEYFQILLAQKTKELEAPKPIQPVEKEVVQPVVEPVETTKKSFWQSLKEWFIS